MPDKGQPLRLGDTSFVCGKTHDPRKNKGQPCKKQGVWLETRMQRIVRIHGRILILASVAYLFIRLYIVVIASQK